MKPRKSWPKGSIHQQQRNKGNWFAMYNSTTRSRPWRLSGMRRELVRRSEGYASDILEAFNKYIFPFIQGIFLHRSVGEWILWITG